jgi:hypothetical protein
MGNPWCGKTSNFLQQNAVARPRRTMPASGGFGLPQTQEFLDTRPSAHVRLLAVSYTLSHTKTVDLLL